MSIFFKDKGINRKMKKRKLMIGVVLASAVLGLVSCGTVEPEVPPIVEAEECSVTFETSGGSKVDGTKVKNGEKVNQPTDPIREGYTFGGWYRKPSCLEVDKWDFTKNNVTADITLYAKWTANKYTVTFKIDGEVYKTQSVEYDKAPKEEKPEREGHTFNGWYTDELCSADKKFDFKSGKVKGETTLYGKWEASGPVVGDKYTVTYVINGHGTQPEGLTDVTTLPASLPVLSEEGWSFGGWYTDNNTFQHQVEGGQAITENTTLYAKWIENEQPVLTYTITYVINGHGTQPEGLTDVTTLPASLPVLSEEGWSFGGWYTDNNTFQHQVEGGQAITENTTLYAKWEVAKYTVTFNSDGGSAVQSQVVEHGQKAVRVSPTKEGYLFLGWYVDEAKTIEFDFVNGVITKDITLYAKWEEDSAEVITVTFNSKGGSEVAPITNIESGSKITKPVDPEREGFTFIGWYKDTGGELTEEFNFETEGITESIVLFAKWERNKIVETITSTFDFAKFNTLAADKKGSDGKTTMDITMDQFTVGLGVKTEAKRLNTQGKDIIFTLTGTLGNSISITGKGASSAADTVITLLKLVGTTYVEVKVLATAPNGVEATGSADNLEAGTYKITTSKSLWMTSLILTEKGESEAPVTYFVNFNSMQGSLVQSQEIAGGELVLEPEAPTRDGYIFLGWYLEESCTNVYDFKTPVSKDITLYAKWEEEVIPPDATTYLVDFVTNCATSIDERIVVEGKTITEPTGLIKEGYRFIGWYTDEYWNQAFDFKTPITKNLTLYAKWEEIITYTISFNMNGFGDQLEPLTKVDVIPTLPTPVSTERTFGGWYYDASCTDKVFIGDELRDNITLYAKWKDKDSLEIIRAEGSLETAYIEWKELPDILDYNVYYKKSTDNDAQYISLDKMLIREYPDRYRADVLGLAAGKYTLKVVPLLGSDEMDNAAVEEVMVQAHDRSGFGFSQNSTYKTASGAYNEDGTLRSDAVVVNVTAQNAKTVTCKMMVDGTMTTLTGLQTILDAKQKRDTTTPLAIRIIGTINLSDLDHISSGDQGIQIKGNKAYSELNITLEGVGEDATIKGFGFLLRNCGNVEFRNFAIMNHLDDAVSIDTNNCNLWIHNMDLYYGQTGGDSDQAKGDGTVDIKKSQYVTVAYNHFFDSGKSCLIDASAMSSGGADYLTYHHNWFDHSDSRHPRIRNGKNIHIYNNYYDGVSKYGVGATSGGSAFVEANYFRNTKYPIMIAKQGSDLNPDTAGGIFSKDVGGMIKAYNNVIIGAKSFITQNDSSTSFDAVVVTNRNDKLTGYSCLSGGATYSEFDTNSNIMYSYTPDDPNKVPELVQAYAGRINGGDLHWTFGPEEDTNYAVIPALKEAVVNYKTTLIRVLGE